MQIKKVKGKVCSFCKQEANFRLGFKKIHILFHTYFCLDCLKKLYSELGKQFVPKSLNEPFMKKIEKDSYEKE